MQASHRFTAPSFGDSCELRVTLRDIAPPVWRTLLVPAKLTLGALHDVLQVAFGWKDYHLHDFTVGGVLFGVPDPDTEEGFFCIDEQAAPLGAFARKGTTFVYRYDYGDDWDHEILVERIVQGAGEAITCTGGERAGPPEDSGGASGYARLLEVLADPKDEEYADMKRWIGRGFDAEKFDVGAVNKKLAALGKRLGRGGR